MRFISLTHALYRKRERKKEKKERKKERKREREKEKKRKKKERKKEKKTKTLRVKVLSSKKCFSLHNVVVKKKSGFN